MKKWLFFLGSILISYVVLGYRPVFASFDFSTDNTQIEFSDELSVFVALDLASSTSGSTYYLRGAFYKENTTKYFGLTQNGNGEWVAASSSSCQSLPSVVVDNQGNWSGHIRVKIDTQNSYYEGAGNYLFKVGRYTQGCSLTWADSAPVNIEVIGSASGSQTNSTQTQSQPVNIELSEFMPNPSDGNEWVELKNKNNYSSDISGYQVDDIEGGSSPFTLPSGSIIPSGGYWILDLSSSKFNNDTDSIRLLNSSGNVLESFDYSTTSAGVSYAKDSNNSWKQTITPTKADQNQINSPATADTTKSTKSDEPSSSTVVAPTSKQSSVPSQVLGSKLAEATSGTDEGGVRNFTYSLDKVETTKDASKAEEPNSSYPIGLIVIFWGVVVLLIVSIILKQRGFFDKIKLR